METVLELYNIRQISNVSTAEKMILSLISSTTPKQQKSADLKYRKLIVQYGSKPSLNTRVAEKKEEKVVKQTNAVNKIIKLTRGRVFLNP